MNISHVATVATFSTKNDDGFRGAYRNEVTKETIRSDVFATKDEARNWVKVIAWEKHPECRFASMKRSNFTYFANVWK